MRAIFLLTFLNLLILNLALYSSPSDFPDYVSSLPNYTSTAYPISFAGFAPMDEKGNDNLYYWYFPCSKADPTTVPTLLWLNGGPATTIAYNVFIENGPLRFKQNEDGGFSVFTVDEPNPRSWSAFYNVLFIDQPIGTGYSYTTTENYTKNPEQVAENIWTGMQYFFTIHPETVDSKWYFTGESFAGRFVPPITNLTLEYNQQIKAGTKKGVIVNLQGMMIACGFIFGVPQRITTIDSSQTASLMTSAQYKQAKTITTECQQLASLGPNNMTQANSRCDEITGYFDEVSGIGAADLLYPTVVLSKMGKPLNVYFNHPDAIKAMHADKSKKPYLAFNASSKIAIQNLAEMRLKTSLPYINNIVTRLPTLIFYGNFDALVGSYGSWDWFKYLQQPYPNILNETRNIWYVKDEPVGFYTQYENLTSVMIDFAGHYIPFSQLDVTVKMLNIFTSKERNWESLSTAPASSVPRAMQDFVQNCNGNGNITKVGTCVCSEGYGLADCSAKAEAVVTDKAYSLLAGGYMFFKVPLKAQDALAQIQLANGTLNAYFIVSANGPVVDHEEAEASLISSKSTLESKTLYLSAHGKQFGYLTIRNPHHSAQANFKISLTPIDPLNVKLVAREKQPYFLGISAQTISFILYGLTFISVAAIGFIITKAKKKSSSYSLLAEELEGKKQDIL